MFYMQAPEKKKKKQLLTAWRSVGLDSGSALDMFYCSCAVTVFAVSVWMGRAVLLAPAHLSEPQYPLKGVSAAGRGIWCQRANCPLIRAACLAGRIEQVQAALWCMNKELGHKNPGKAEFAGVNLQIHPIKVEGLGSPCCKKPHTHKATVSSLPSSKQSIMQFPSCCPEREMVYDQKPVLLQTETLMRLRMPIQWRSDNCRAPADFWGSDSPGHRTSQPQFHFRCWNSITAMLIPRQGEYSFRAE